MVDAMNQAALELLDLKLTWKLTVLFSTSMGFLTPDYLYMI
jgi:hypothetical protein